MTHFSALDYTLFVAYLIAMVSVGFLFVREQHTVKDFFLAGRSMGSFVVCISVIAALSSGTSYLGAPGEVYSNGLAFFWVSFAFFLATPFTTLFLLPFFYRSRFFTAYQYLEERFSLPVRLLVSTAESSSTLKATPLFVRSVTIRYRSAVERAKRSSLVTISVSPSRT